MVGEQMKECCQNCGLALNLERYFYGPTGCDHDAMPGFVCMAFRDEGVAVWMMGVDVEKGRCEMHRPKGEKYASVKG
jgi:hypothetical protein